MPLQLATGALTSGLFYSLGLSNEWVVGAAALYLGVVLRDFGYARLIARSWPVQRDLFDWLKIDAMLKERGLPSHGA